MTTTNEPITEMVVNSVIAAPSENQQVGIGQPVEVSGVAWDGGYGVRRVDVSSDNGASWQAATLGPDLGRFAFRAWNYRFTPKTPGNHTLLAKASNAHRSDPGRKPDLQPGRLSQQCRPPADDCRGLIGGAR